MNREVGRELRQLRLISEQIRIYRAGELSLSRLIADLDTLWNQMRIESSAWSEAFRGHWWTLEQIYAVSVDRGCRNLSEDCRVLVEEAVDQLGFLVDEALEELSFGDSGA